MNKPTTLIHAFHPHPDRSRVQRRWLESLAGIESLTINLPYSQYPDGRIDVAREQALLLEHQRVVFMFPLYWYSVPPLMKAWMDEVLQLGWAYGPGATALRGKSWLSVISTGGASEGYQAGGFNEYSLSELLRPLQRTAGMLGMDYEAPYVEYAVRGLDDAGLALSCERLRARLLEPQALPA